MMQENHNREVIYQNTQLLISQWRQDALKTEKFEYADDALKLIAEKPGQPLPVISLICANYETYMISGQRQPTLHRDLVWNDRGLRKGYLLCHEEIPHRLNQLQIASQRPIEHLIVLVDQGMAETLYKFDTPENINLTLDDNAQTMKSLIDHGNQNSWVFTQVKRLTHLVSDDFYSHWNDWNQLLRTNLNLNTLLTGQIRRDLVKDAAYYKYAWGLTSTVELQQRVIDQQYGLTGTIGDSLNTLHDSVFNSHLPSKTDLILLDTIPGPTNPAHGEFIAYNADKPNGESRPKTPIIRPFHNLVLLSDPAIEVPYLNKNLETIMTEANNFNM